MNDRMLSDEILLGLIKANSGGGGGGTTDYDDLSNKPQIAGTTLSGNKSLADLGIASASDVETALDRKQDVLLYGGANPSTGADGDMYVKLVRDESTLIDMFGSPSAESTDDYEMSYAVDSSVMGDYYDYEAFGTGKGFGQNGRGSMTITYHFKNSKFKPVNVSYCNNFSLSGSGYLESANFTIKASNDGTNWDTLYSTSSSCPRDTSVSADITANTYYSYFKFEMNSGGGYTGIRNIVMNGISESYSNIDNIYFKNDGTWLKDSFAHKSEIDAIKDGTSIDSFADVETALTGKQDTLTFDDTPTDNSNNPVKSNGIYDALALKQNATDNNLETEAKTIVGAINENANDISSLESGFTALDNEVNGDATTYPYADVITIEDAVPANLADCTVKIEPDQNLHGYDKPWVGGAGKNKLPLVLADIKTMNTTGTWSGNAYTVNDVTFTILTDDDDNVIGVNVNGTANVNVGFKLFQTDSVSAFDGMVLNGCPNDGSLSKYRIAAAGYNSGTFVKDYNNLGSDVTLTLTADNIDSLYVSITAFQGYNIQNLKFYPMIRLSTETDATFAPYTNICPISGHTEASVKRFGANLYAGSAFLKTAGNWYSDNILQRPGASYLTITSNRVYGTAGSYRWIAFPFEFKKDVKVYCVTTLSEISASRVFDSSGSQVSSLSNGYTPSEDFSGYIGIGINDGTYDFYFGVGLNINLDVTHEPSKLQTYTIALGDTIYGGTVDFNTGVVTVTHGIHACDGTETISVSASGDVFKIERDNGNSFMAEFNVGHGTASDLWKIPQVSHYKGIDYIDSPNMPNGTSCCYIGGKGITIAFKDTNYSSESDFTAYLLAQYTNGTPVTFRLPLETPFTVQLTPQQIQLLKGQNTLTASTGQISVTVNGVSGAIGAVQEQVNDHEERIETLESGGGSSDDYTNTEQVVGTWMGEPLYRKSYYNASYSSGDVDFNISNIKAVIKIEGMAQIRFVENDYDSFIPIPYINGNVNAENKFQQGPATQTGKITMSIGNNYTALLPVKLYMTMYYTKSTT